MRYNSAVVGLSPHIVIAMVHLLLHLKKTKKHSSLTEGKTKLGKQQLVQKFNHQISEDSQPKLFSGTHILLSVYVLEKSMLFESVYADKLFQSPFFLFINIIQYCFKNSLTIYLAKKSLQSIKSNYTF